MEVFLIPIFIAIAIIFGPLTFIAAALLAFDGEDVPMVFLGGMLCMFLAVVSVLAALTMQGSLTLN
jgi:hypothetical protein